MTRVMTLFDSSIGKKAIMAATGLIFFGYVVAHMLGNLQIYLGPEMINGYAEKLHAVPPLLLGARLALLLALALHIWAATSLTLTNWKARPVGYRQQRYLSADYASRTMIWSGPLLALFVVYHVAHLTLGSVHPDFRAGDVYHNVVIGFQNPWVSGFYIAAMLALGLHMYHGLWSMLQSVGVNHPGYNVLRRVFAVGFTVLVVGGDISIPVAVLSGILKVW